MWYTVLSRFVDRGSFMAKIDEKSGYDHILLFDDSHQYFGIEWQADGGLMVLPFLGLKNSGVWIIAFMGNCLPRLVSPHQSAGPGI